MSNQRASRQELNRRRRQTGFVGRTGELTVFRDNLTRDPQDEGFQYLFHVHGNAGVGKTTLVRQWETAARARKAVTAYVDDDVHSVIEAMEAVSAQLARQGVVLKAFQDLLTTYRQRRHEIETAPGALAAADGSGTGQGNGQGQASTSSTVMAQAGLVGLGLIPGVGALAGAMDPQQLAQNTDRLRAMVSARFRNHDDVQLVVAPLQVLTPVFLADLAKAAERRPWIVLFFDVFERTGPVLNEWLRDVLVGEEYGGLPDNVVAVLSGQGSLDARCWADHLYLVSDVPLEVFTEEEARSLLASHGVTGEQVVEVILQLTGRLPVLVDLLAQTRPQDPGDIGDPSGTAVERFLKWITDPERRAAALTCALPLQLDEDVCRAAVPDAAADQYPWLRGLPFVTGQGGRCRYHDIVRGPMLRLQRTQSPVRWQEQHTRLAEAFRRWRETREAGLQPEAYWDDTPWREHRLNETYHLLCANPALALPDALLQVAHACDDGTAALRRWAQTLAQAGGDTDTPALVTWGHRLQEAADDESTGVVTALTRLLAAPEFSPAGRPLAHTIRGREHRVAARYDRALGDYATALALDPDFARAHYGRGETYSLTERFDEAVASVSRAIELAPADSEYIASRALTYRQMRRYDDALADYDRALALRPDSDWIMAGRGETYRLMGRNAEALADFDGAIAADPAYAWAIGSRAQTYQAMERYEEALADYDRAIAIDADSAWIVAGRGEIHRLTDRYEEALADFDRAVEADPHYYWAVGSRAQTYRLMDRYDDALADYNRAIEGDPHSAAWIVAGRGEIHRLTDRYEEALADFDRAVDLDPGYAWAIGNRAQTYRLMGRNDQALVDFDRAITTGPPNAWIIAGRGESHRLLQHYDQALTDFGRAIDLDPRYAWAIGSRAQTYLAMGRNAEALADFDRAAEIKPDSDWIVAGLAETYRLLGRYEDSLAHFARALEIDPSDSSYHYRSALALHPLDRPDEQRRHWHAAVDLLTAEAAADGPDAPYVGGYLMLIRCGLAEWDEAAAELARFLAADPGVRRIREVARHLAEIQEALALEPGLLLPLWEGLEAAESSSAAESAAESVDAGAGPWVEQRPADAGDAADAAGGAGTAD